MPAPNFSLSEYWKSRFAHTSPKLRLPLDSREAYDAWLPQARAKFAELMGRMPEPVPLQPEVTEAVDCGSYVRERVVLQTEMDMSLPCYLLIPKDRTEPGPAILAQHGHGEGKSDVCGVWADETKRKDIEDLNYSYAHRYAERGYVVIAPDLRCFGERYEETPGYLSACDFNYVMATMLGYNLLALDIWDMQRAVDYLQQHALVDPDRIGMTGLSQGGTMTLFTTAFEPRIKAAVCSGYFNSWWDCALIPWNMCGSQILFGVLEWFDHLELAGMIAPRPFLVEIGTRDPIFPVKTTEAEFAKLAQLYDTLGVRDRLDIDVFDAGHIYSGDKAFDWFAKWL
jgi:dienelactone hydrolase